MRLYAACVFLSIQSGCMRNDKQEPEDEDIDRRNELKGSPRREAEVQINGIVNKGLIILRYSLPYSAENAFRRWKKDRSCTFKGKPSSTARETSVLLSP